MLNYVSLFVTIVLASLVSGVIMFMGSMMIMKSKWFAKKMAKWAETYVNNILSEAAVSFQDEEL